MAHPVTHFEVNARDAAAMQRFYCDLFGWGIDTDNPQSYGMIDTKASGRGINGGIGASQNGTSWLTFYVDTPDIDATLAKVERLGGRTVMPAMSAGMVTYALFSDPEGNVVGLAKMASPPAPRAQPRARTSRAKPATRRTAARRAAGRKRTGPKRTTSTRTRRRR